MSTFGAYRRLNVELMWALAGVPLCVFAGVAWDITREANGTQMFLGAAQNFFLVWMMPIALLGFAKGVVRSFVRGGINAWFYRGAALFVAWTLWSQTQAGALDALKTSVIPITGLLCVMAGLVAFAAARAARAEGLGPELECAARGAFALAGLGVVIGGAAHLLGPLPTIQPFLYVDGFGNIRTLGEVGMLAAAATLATLLKRPSLVAFVLAALFVAAVAWSGTRAAWVGLGGTLAVCLLVWLPGWLAASRALAAIALGFALSLPLPLPDSNYGAMRVEALAQEASIVAQGGNATETDGKGSNRMALWGWGVDKISERPWTGHGLAGMVAIPDKPKEARFMHLHNLPLDAAFGLGIPVALLLGLLLAAASGAALWRARTDRLFFLPLAAIATLGTGLFAGVFLFPLMTVAVGIGLAGAWPPGIHLLGRDGRVPAANAPTAIGAVHAG